MLLALLGPHKQQQHAQERTARRIMRNGIRRGLVAMQVMNRESWSEDEVRALPQGEHNLFDRKSGAWLASDGFREDLGKAISAIANSGGGQLIIGVANDGTFDGVEPLRGRTSTREWMEQIVPPSVSPPLAEFRVHEVTRSTESEIPDGRVVLVVDIANSAIAPHQAEARKQYFYRQAGRSEPAPHFYLEALRNRYLGRSSSPHSRGFASGMSTTCWTVDTSWRVP